MKCEVDNRFVLKDTFEIYDDSINVANQVNSCQLVGRITSDFERSHEQRTMSFVTFRIAVPRNSGKEDIIPVICDVELILEYIDKSPIGRYVNVEGRFCSFLQINEDRTASSKKYLYVRELHITDDKDEFLYPIGTNVVVIEGELNYNSVYRNTPLGRKITELPIICRRPNGRPDHLTAIAWGINALDAADLVKGDRVKITGRLQSRIYNKDGEKTVYEISVKEFEVQTQSKDSLVL